MTKGKFQFSNKSAQQAEARKNAQEARAFVEKWVPAKPEATEQPETTAAGACFRRVSAILAGRSK